MKYIRFAGIAFIALLMGSWTVPAHAQTQQICANANCWFQVDEANDPGYQSALHNGSYYYGQSGSPYGYGYSAYNAPYSAYPSYDYTAPTYSQYPYPSTLIGTPPQSMSSYPAPGYSYNYQYQYAYQYQQQYPNPQPTYAYASQPSYQQQYVYPQTSQIVRTYWKNGCYYTVRLVNGIRRTTHVCGY